MHRIHLGFFPIDHNINAKVDFNLIIIEHIGELKLIIFNIINSLHKIQMFEILVQFQISQDEIGMFSFTLMK